MVVGLRTSSELDQTWRQLLILEELAFDLLMKKPCWSKSVVPGMWSYFFSNVPRPLKKTMGQGGPFQVVKKVCPQQPEMKLGPYQTLMGSFQLQLRPSASLGKSELVQMSETEQE